MTFTASRKEALSQDCALQLKSGNLCSLLTGAYSTSCGGSERYARPAGR